MPLLPYSVEPATRLHIATAVFQQAASYAYPLTNQRDDPVYLTQETRAKLDALVHPDFY